MSGAAAKQKPVEGQAVPGHSQQDACAPADPTAPRGSIEFWRGVGLGVTAPAMRLRPLTCTSISRGHDTMLKILVI